MILPPSNHGSNQNRMDLPSLKTHLTEALKRAWWSNPSGSAWQTKIRIYPCDATITTLQMNLLESSFAEEMMKLAY
jgi:hypothetical protein